jgi:hypothetical protein
MGVAERKGVAGWRESISAHTLESFPINAELRPRVRSGCLVERMKPVANMAIDRPLTQGVLFDNGEETLL